MASRLNAQFHKVRAFTLIELLVVVAVIGILITIVVAVMFHAKTAALNAAAKSQMAQLQMGMEQYYSAFNMYPPSSAGVTGNQVYASIKPGRGSAMLAEGLMGWLPGSQDGAGTGSVVGSDTTDLGFRLTNTAMGGKVYGPYASADTKGYRIATTGLNDQYFIDPWGKEILYYRSLRQPKSVGPTVTKMFDKVANNDSFFAVEDNATDWQGNALPDPSNLPTTPATALTATKAFYNLMSAGASTNTVSGPVLGSDNYILLSAGPDGIYFTGDDVIVSK